MAAANPIAGIQQLEAELLGNDDDEEGELPGNIMFQGQAVEDNAVAISLDDLLQHYALSQVASMPPRTEQLPWPLAEARPFSGVGAFGAPLLRSEFVSEFVQIRRFKENCLAQLREIQEVVHSCLGSPPHLVDISCRDVQVQPVEQILHEMLSNDLQALHADGRAGSFVKRPPYSERQKKRAQAFPGEEANGPSPGAAQGSQPFLRLMDFEESHQPSAQAVGAATVPQADDSRGPGASVQQGSLPDALGFQEAIAAPSVDPLTALLSEADIHSQEQELGDVLLSTAEAPLLGRESIDSLLEAMKPPLDLGDSLPNLDQESGLGLEGHPGQSLQASSLSAPTSPPKLEQQEPLTGLEALPRQQPLTAAGMQETIHLAPIDIQTAAGSRAGGSPTQSQRPLRSNEPGPGSENALESGLEANGLAAHGGGASTEPIQAPQNGTQVHHTGNGLPGRKAEAAKQKGKQRNEAQRKDKRKAARQAALSGRLPGASWGENKATQEMLAALAEWRVYRERMRNEAPLRCIRDCPDDQRASVAYKKAHYYTQDDEFPPCVDPVPPEVVITARVFDPSNRNTGYQEHMILGSQQLTQFRDRITCPVDTLAREAGQGTPSGFFFIEDTFFDDMRGGASAVRYSAPIVEWAAAQPSPRGGPAAGAVRYEQRDMERYTFEDLNVRVGAEYLYCHQGNCEHKLVFTDVRMLNRFDVLDLSAYALLRYRTQRPPKKCHICCKQQASKITVGDELVPESPCLFCEQCFDALHRTKAGELHPADLEVYQFTSDMH